MDDFDFNQPEYRILLALREDYLPDLEDLRIRMPQIGQNRMRLTRMNAQQAYDAISKPGRDLVSADVCSRIVAFVAASRRGEAAAGSGQGPDLDPTNSEVAPALLSLLCHELNRKRQDLKLAQITVELVDRSSASILQDFYARCVDGQPEAVRRFIEDELLTESGLRESIALEKGARSWLREARASRRSRSWSSFGCSTSRSARDVRASSWRTTC